MSTEAFPVLYYNMAGEMIYIVEQRLTAQSIDSRKANKVMNDILVAIFSPALVNEVFKRQQLLTVLVVRQMFEKLAHSSIMKLNEQSMNKLFDLMVMVTKYQMVACNTPMDLIDITMNHFNSMCDMSEVDQTLKCIQSSKEKFLNYYLNMNWAQLQHIRYTMLSFLQDIKTRVSIFLRDGTQENDGRFVIKPEGVVSCDCQIPGFIKYFNANDEVIALLEFPSQGLYVVSNVKTTLGLNIYTKEYNSQKDGTALQSIQQNADMDSNISEKSISNQEKDSVNSDSAKHESVLLAKLIGKQEQNQIEPEMDFWLSFGTEESANDESNKHTNHTQNELNLTEGIQINKNLEKIINDLNIDENESHDNSGNNNNYNNNEDDLLALMDS